MKLLFVALFSALLQAQDPAGVIDVQVSDADTRAPLDGVRIVLQGPTRRTAETAFGGGFRFDHLQPGDYTFVLTKAGYLDSTKGAPPRTVQLKPGAVKETVAITMTALGAIEGTVFDEDNQPLNGVCVTTAGLSKCTLKDGRFAFEDLVPDAYQLAVSVPHGVRAANLTRDAATGDIYGYAPAQYYPGASDARLAIPVTVTPGARVSNLKLHLRRTLLVDFTGYLVEMTSAEPLTDAQVQLIGGVSAPADPLWIKRAVNSDGGFRFSILEPGSYTLAVYRDGTSTLPYLVPIEVGKMGVEDRKVTVPPWVTLEGRLRAPGAEPRWQGSSHVSLQGVRSGGSNCGYVMPDGTFECPDIPPGEAKVHVSAVRMQGQRAQSLAVKEIRFGGQDGLRKPITVSETGNPTLDILFSDAPSGISGQIVDDKKEKSPYLVTIGFGWPAGAQVGQTLGFQGSLLRGSDFQFPGLAPGDYEVTARRVPRTGGSFVPSAICDQTVRVTVRDGAVTYVTLRPCE